VDAAKFELPLRTPAAIHKHNALHVQGVKGKVHVQTTMAA
jgi:hypothetical protein